MSVTSISLADILQKHVTLEVESIDRMYLNVYIPNLQREANVSWFLKQHRHCPVARRRRWHRSAMPLSRRLKHMPKRIRCLC